MLSGVFSPIITGRNYELVFVGTMILFVSLLGGIFLYNGITKNDTKFLTIGLAIISASLIAIMMLSWRRNETDL